MSEFNLYLTKSKFLKQTHDVILNFVSVCHKMKHWNLMFTHWVVFVFKKKKRRSVARYPGCNFWHKECTYFSEQTSHE